MLCTNGHNNDNAASICAVCGINTFAPPASAPTTVVYHQSRGTNTLAIISLITALVGISPAALVCGYMARRQIKETHEEGDGFALAGIIIGWVSLGLTLLMIVFVLVFFAAASSSINSTCVPSNGITC